MKIVLISAGSSVHTRRWANGLLGAGNEVTVISAHRFQDGYHPSIVKVKLPYRAPIGYILNRFALRRALRCIAPDIVNTHFASGYGLLSRNLTQYPHLISVWGSDVYDFPNRSRFHRNLLVGTLRRATRIASTSEAMQKRVEALFSNAKVYLTPFGIDIERFTPTLQGRAGGGPIWIGTVKGLNVIYGVDTLIRAFGICYDALGRDFDIRLRIVGDGPQAHELKELVAELGLSGVTLFEGSIPHEAVPKALREMDVFVALSRSESFGVSILEAGACGLPVVVSDADGPKEVTLHGKTGLIVPIGDVGAAADALCTLVINPECRVEMGREGRALVCRSYSWEMSINRMLESYKKTVDAFHLKTRH